MSFSLGQIPGAGALGGIGGTLSDLPNFVLTLGPVTFEEFEIPATLSAGGDQMLSVHKYPGGLRTIDTFGPDDHDIGWSGVFTDDAEDRCQMLDSLRKQGQQLPLNFSTFFYTVVIKSFTWNYERPWKIGYSIMLAVVQDKNNPSTQDGGGSFDDQINSDASTAASNTATLNAQPYAAGATAFGSSH